MNYSILIANKGKGNILKVGAVLILNKNIVYSFYLDSNITWYEKAQIIQEEQ